MSSLDDGPQESFDKVKVTEAAAWPVALASCAVTKMSDADGNGDDNGDDNDNGDFLRACVWSKVVETMRVVMVPVTMMVVMVVATIIATRVMIGQGDDEHGGDGGKDGGDDGESGSDHGHYDGLLERPWLCQPPAPYRRSSSRAPPP